MFFCLLIKSKCYVFRYSRYLSRRLSVDVDAPVFINLDDLIVTHLQVFNLAPQEVNYSIKLPRETEPLVKGVVKKTLNQTIDPWMNGLPDGTVLRFDNNKNVTAILYVTVWYLYCTYSYYTPPLNPNVEKSVFYEHGSNICQVQKSEKLELTWIQKHTNDLSFRDYFQMSINIIPIIGPAIDFFVQTFWFYGSSQYRDGTSLFQSILHDLNVFMDKLNQQQWYKNSALNMKVIQQKLMTINELLHQTSNKSYTKLNETEKKNIDLSNTIITDLYLNLVDDLNGREVSFMPNEKSRHLYLQMAADFIGLQLKIFNIGLLQTTLTQDMRNDLREKGVKIPFIEKEKDLLHLEAIKTFLKISIRNFNSFVQDLVDNMYNYAYEDSVADQNIYNSVAKAHNIILKFGIEPIHSIIDKYFVLFNITVDFKIVDLPRPYLYFSALYGVQTLESARQASNMISNLYSLPMHEISRSVSRMDVQLNSKKEIVTIKNYDGEKYSFLDFNHWSTCKILYSSFQLFKIKIGMWQYIKKAEICLAKDNDWLTKVKQIKLFMSNNDRIDVVVTSNRTNLMCTTFELEHHSIYRVTVFSDGCTDDGNAVSAAVVYKHLNNSNELLTE